MKGKRRQKNQQSVFGVRTKRLLPLLTPCLIRRTGYFWVRHRWMDDKSCIHSSCLAFRSVGVRCGAETWADSTPGKCCNGKGRGGTDDSSRRDLVAEDSAQRCFNGMLTAISSSPRVRHIAANNVKRLLSAVVATQDQSQRRLIHWFPLSRRVLRGVCRTVLPCGTDTFEKFDLPLLGFKPHMLRH